MSKEYFLMLLSQVVFFTVLLILFRKKLDSGTAVISVVTALATPYLFVVAMFLGGFGTNLCYSSAISSLSKVSELVVGLGSKEANEIYVESIREIPLFGYESQCTEVEAHISKLEKSIVAFSAKANEIP
ncbi:MAG: hypothetical protein KJ989_20610 [Gammaproteobacteria bacterium]|nr:hypothetical protein [Gammaproteobacteria bacterium]MBU2256760.1 hypothetical protein [Gammaproteobacteria bacterium]MBU2296599.1 hypothetical protein [Gammaproteobacteria bacterium]